MLFHCCEELQHSLLLLVALTRKTFWQALVSLLYRSHAIWTINWPTSTFTFSSFVTILVTSRAELFAVVCSTHWDLSFSFLCFVFVFTHLVSCFVCAPSLSVYWHEQSKRLAKHEKSTCIRWQIEQRWDEFMTTEQRTTTTSTDWVVPKTFEIFDALLA